MKIHGKTLFSSQQHPAKKRRRRIEEADDKVGMDQQINGVKGLKRRAIDSSAQEEEEEENKYVQHNDYVGPNKKITDMYLYIVHWYTLPFVHTQGYFPFCFLI